MTYFAEAGYEYYMVLVEDITGFLWLGPAPSSSAATTARALIHAVFRPPKA